MSLQGGVGAFSTCVQVKATWTTPYLSLLLGMGWGLIPCSRVIQQCFEGALAPHAAQLLHFVHSSTDLPQLPQAKTKLGK